MSEENAQHSYVETEVLIDSARVLSSSFPSIGVVLAGNELEILRNMLNYATRRRTFVGAYHDNYYLVADDDDWLDIESIVAVLEEKLMGNDNVLWGYGEQLVIREDNTTTGAGAFVQSHDDVPADEVWIVTGVSFFSDKATGIVNIYARAPVAAIGLVATQSMSINKYVAPPIGRLVLEEGDNIEFSWSGLSASQRIISNVWGYKMNV